MTAKFSTVARRRVCTTDIEILVGDIASEDGIDAIIHPTTSSLTLAGGVGKAIAAKADHAALASACDSLKPLPNAEAIHTPSFGLACNTIIHCCGPNWSDSDPTDQLSATYWNVFSLADRLNLKSLAIPAISSGGKGFPIEVSAQIAIGITKSACLENSKLEKVRFVLTSTKDANAYAAELQRYPPVSPSHIGLEIDIKYSPQEFERMRKGFVGDQDTKWSIVFEDPWLCFYRGGPSYGNCHFWLRLPDSDKPASFIEVWAHNKLPDPKSPWQKHKAEELLKSILDKRFDLMFISDQKEQIGSAEVWTKRDKVALNFFPGEVGMGLLSSDDAERLGNKLIELASELRNKL